MSIWVCIIIVVVVVVVVIVFIVGISICVGVLLYFLRRVGCFGSNIGFTVGGLLVFGYRDVMCFLFLVCDDGTTMALVFTNLVCLLGEYGNLKPVTVDFISSTL